MRAARILTVLAAVLALGSCQVLEFIFGSVFPSTVGLAKARADLSGQIDQNSAGAFHLRVVQSGSNGYVILIGDPAGTGTVAYVYDLNLSLKATLTGLTGDGVMVDAGGFIAIGTQYYDPVTLAVAGPVNNTLASNGNPSGTEGFNNGTSQEIFNLTVDSASFLHWNLTGYPPWAGGAAGTSLSPLSASLTGLQIAAVLDDGNPAGAITVAVIQSSNNNRGSATCWFLTTAKSNFPLVNIPASWLDNSPHADNIVTDCIGFAQGSIIAYDGSAGRFLRINPSDGSVQSSFYSGTDMTSTRLGYIVSGGFFYGFDEKTRVLTKYAAWW